MLAVIEWGVQRQEFTFIPDQSCNRPVWKLLPVMMTLGNSAERRNLG